MFSGVSHSLTIGGKISTLRLIIVAIEVEAVPIIWFMASATALSSNSVNWVLVGSPVPPIIKSAITMASLTSNSIKLLPKRPSLNSTVVATFGATRSFKISPNLILDTRGVVILTRRSRMEDNVVAACDMEIFPTSPIMSTLTCSSNPCGWAGAL